MTDIRADDATPLDRDDRLPWLEAVEDEEGGEGPSAFKLVVAVLIGLIAIGGLVGGAFWLSNRGGGAGPNAELIKAPSGAYKVRPDDPGGMTVEGEGETAFAASAGEDPKGRINTNAVPEAPVTETRGRPVETPPSPKAAAPAPTASAQGGLIKAPPPSNGPSGSIQLGAFSSEAGANNAWKALSGRFSYLAPLSHSIVPVQAGGRTLYRLRASGPGARDLCGRLRVAGETCVSFD